MGQNDNQMYRSVGQALYRYLPCKWIDFYKKESRENFSAYVTHWNSNILQNINNKRLLRLVSQSVKNFEAIASLTNPRSLEGFATTIDETTYNVLTPKISEVNLAVSSTINPLAFHCEKCHKVKQFYNSSDYFNAPKTCCGVKMTQSRLIRYCVCGYAEGTYVPKCDAHGYNYIIRDKNGFSYTCTKCQKHFPLQKACPECKEQMVVKPALDTGHFFPFSLSIIDLLDKKKDIFLESERQNGSQNGEYVVIAHLLGLISDADYVELIKQGRIESDADFSVKMNAERESLKALGIEESVIDTIIKGKSQQAQSHKIISAIDTVKAAIGNLEQNNIRSIAEEIMEYEELVNPRKKVTLDEAIISAKELDANANPDNYKVLAQEFGILNTQLCSHVPIVFCSYGYTRKERDASKNKIRLRGFPEEEKGKKNVYAARLETEGVLFEFDKKKIINWLIKNDYVSAHDLPQSMSDKDLQTWFIDKIKAADIKPFTPIEDPITSIVYKLIHSISHLLIRQASEICGLDRNSLSEYILPNIPAIFIYCQNSQGFNMGALYNAFQVSFDKWLLNAKSDAEKCIFDPICIDETKACAGCLFLNEISCQHFNKDLDRSLIVGHYDRKEKKRHYGFWEKK